MKRLYAIITFCLFCGYTAFTQTISSNAPLCGNANLTLELTATGGSTYAWTGPNGFTSTLQKPSIKNVNWKNRGVYTVTIDNKTTLTIDVNIKDPVAFTVPKEITVCEGGTLIIEPKTGRLTDSTEVVGYYSYRNPVGESVVLPFKNFALKDAGVYQVTGDVYSNNSNIACSITQKVNVKINTSKDCKSIEIEDLSKVKVCLNQEVSIPFTTKGTFKQGTKFSVYILGYNESLNSQMTPDAIVEKSPIIISEIPKKYWDNRFKIIIIADDAERTTITSNVRDYLNNFSNVGLQSSSTCDSVILMDINSNYYKNYVSSYQWFLDGQALKNATKSDFVAKKSGAYTLKVSYNYQFYDIDKTCIFESQPIKIELGKIQKPSVYVSNDIELCVGKPATLNVITNTSTTYRWKKDGNYIANATKPTFETLQEGKYQVEAKEGTCTTVSDTVVLKKLERFQNLSIKPINSIRGEEINNTYQLCNNQSFDIDIQQALLPNTRLQIIKNGTVIKDTISNIIRGIKGNGDYFVKADYGTCSGISNTISIKYDKFILVSSSYIYNKNINLCEGQTRRLDINSERLYNNDLGNVKYSLQEGKIYKNNNVLQDWNYNSGYYYSYFDVNQSGNYYGIGIIKLEDGSTCNLYSDTINVTTSKRIQDIPYYYDKSIGAIPIKSCKDTVNIDTYYYYGSGQYGRETAYKWTKDGVILKQDSSRVLQAIQVGNYQLETTYKGGCIVTSSPYNVDFGKIGVNFYNNLTSTICEGNSQFLYLNLTGNPDKSSYDFTKDGKTISTTLQSSYILTQSGTYKLKVSNGKCEGTSPDFVLKVDKIPITITPTDSVTFCAGKTVDLKASTETGLSYIWERNGSVINQANQATLTASTDGLYKATLLRGGCWGTTPSVKLKSLANIIPTATLTGDKKLDLDQETKLSINLTSYAPWTFKLSDGKEYTATKSPFEIAVKPLTTTTYSLSEVSNICGVGSFSGTAKIEVIVLSTEEEKELDVEVFPMPSSEICHWKIQTPQATLTVVELFDVSGVSEYRSASSIRSQTHEGIIDLSKLKVGTYFLKIQADGKSVTRKVVKF